MQKWLMSAVAMIVAIGLGGTAAAQSPDKIVIATEGAYPPFSMVDKDGNLVGFDVDFANRLCKVIKRECELVAQDWEAMIPGLLAEEYDVIIAQMSITEERKRSVDFTEYYVLAPAIFAAAEGVIINAYADGKAVPGALDGLVIGVQRATTHSSFLEDNFPDAEVRLYATQQEANEALIAGRVDATLADTGLLDAWVHSPAGRGFAFASSTFSPPKWYGEGAGMALRKGEEELKKLLEHGLNIMLRDGSYWQINYKYFPMSINLHPNP